MYTMPDTLNTINANMTHLALFGGVANLLAYIQIIYGAWIGYRDKSHAIPIAALTMFFAHDSYYDLNYGYWIHTVHHPFFVANLGAMCVFVIFEVILMWQTVTYSREEAGLGRSAVVAWLNLIAIQAGMYIAFLWFKSMLDDPLYLECFSISVVFSNLFNIPMLLRRGSRKGQSLIIAWALLIQTGPMCFFLVGPLYGAYFSQPIWLAAGAANTVLAAVYLWMLYRAPAYHRVRAKTMPA